MLVFAAGIAYAETKADDVVGVYYTDGKQSKIEIFKEGDKYCGKLVWLKNPNYGDSDAEAGKPQHDRNNPDAARKNDPILGLKLLKDFTFDGSANWNGGTIYDPESGKTYKCTMKLTDPKTLDVRGYIGVPAFGRSTTWTRVDEKEEATAAAPATGTNTESPAPAAAGGDKKEEKKN